MYNLIQAVFVFRALNDAREYLISEEPCAPPCKPPMQAPHASPPCKPPMQAPHASLRHSMI